MLQIGHGLTGTSSPLSPLTPSVQESILFLPDRDEPEAQGSAAHGYKAILLICFPTRADARVFPALAQAVSSPAAAVLARTLVPCPTHKLVLNVFASLLGARGKHSSKTLRLETPTVMNSTTLGLLHQPPSHAPLKHGF